MQIVIDNLREHIQPQVFKEIFRFEGYRRETVADVGLTFCLELRQGQLVPSGASWKISWSEEVQSELPGWLRDPNIFAYRQEVQPQLAADLLQWKGQNRLPVSMPSAGPARPKLIEAGMILALSHPVIPPNMWEGRRFLFHTYTETDLGEILRFPDTQYTPEAE